MSGPWVEICGMGETRLLNLAHVSQIMVQKGTEPRLANGGPIRRTFAVLAYPNEQPRTSGTGNSWIVLYECGSEEEANAYLQWLSVEVLKVPSVGEGSTLNKYLLDGKLQGAAGGA